MINWHHCELSNKFSVNPSVQLDAHALILGLILAANILAQQSQIFIGVTAASYDSTDYKYDDIHDDDDDRSGSFNESIRQIDDGYTLGARQGCGVSSVKQQPKQRIYRGRAAKPGEIPWQVRLIVKSRDGYARCGAVIVGDTTILTAAHCVVENKCTRGSFGKNLGVVAAQNFDASIGDLRQNNPDGEQRIAIRKVVLHEDFCKVRQSLHAHDIALLQTSTRMNFRITSTGYGSVNAICLPPSNRQYKNNQPVRVSGWGHSDTRRLLVSQPRSRHRGGGGGNYSSHSQPDPLASGPTRRVPNALLVADLNLLLTRSCRRFWHELITDQVCASFDQSGACYGDSGGPLYAYIGSSQRAELVGLVSFGPKYCASDQLPSAYTNVHSHLAWIRANQ